MVIEAAPIGPQGGNNTMFFCGAPGKEGQEGPGFVACRLRRLWIVSTLFWPGPPPLFWEGGCADRMNVYARGWLLFFSFSFFFPPPPPSLLRLPRPHEPFRNLSGWGPRARDKTGGAVSPSNKAEAAMTTSSRLEEGRRGRREGAGWDESRFQGRAGLSYVKLSWWLSRFYAMDHHDDDKYEVRGKEKKPCPSGTDIRPSVSGAAGSRRWPDLPVVSVVLHSVHCVHRVVHIKQAGRTGLTLH